MQRELDKQKVKEIFKKGSSQDIARSVTNYFRTYITPKEIENVFDGGL